MDYLINKDQNYGVLYLYTLCFGINQDGVANMLFNKYINDYVKYEG